MELIHKSKEFYKKGVELRRCIVCKHNTQNKNQFSTKSKCFDCLDLVNNDEKFETYFNYVPRFEPIEYEEYL